MDPLVSPGAELEPAELGRYSRHLLIPDIGMVGQRRLKNARVLVVGAGGLGSPALLYLAAAGVGTIGVIDFDVVDESNLQRQVLHGVADVGRSKVESAAARLAELNPLVTVRTHREPLTADNARAVVAEYDLVVDGADNFATRYLVNDACALAGLPCVWASIFRFDGQVSVFWAGHGPCYRCIYPEPPPPGAVPSCAEGGVLGVLPGVIGSVQAAEAIKLITGAGEPLVGRLLVHDALGQDWRTLRVEADPGCPLCGPDATIDGLVDYGEFCGTPAPGDPVEEDDGISAEELRRLLAERSAGRADFTLIDIREPAETAVSQIAGAELVPKGLIEADPDRLPPGAVVLYCRSGARSGQVRELLRARGRDVEHLRGGITAWAGEIEPGLPV